MNSWENNVIFFPSLSETCDTIVKTWKTGSELWRFPHMHTRLTSVSRGSADRMSSQSNKWRHVNSCSFPSRSAFGPPRAAAAAPVRLAQACLLQVCGSNDDGGLDLKALKLNLHSDFSKRPKTAPATI